MAETRLVVEHREQLWSLQVEAVTTAATISEQLAGHLPQDLRPAQDQLVTDPAS